MFRKIFAICLVALAGMGLSASLSNASQLDRAAKKCDTRGAYPPASYVTSIKVRGVGCPAGKKIVKAYHNCRKQKGGSGGTCSGVRGFKCREARRQEVPEVQYSTTVSCSKGSRRVISSYTQNI